MPRSTPPSARDGGGSSSTSSIGLPTETDEDTLGIVELAKQCVAIGRRYHQGGDGDRLGGGVRPQAADPLPVVRPEHHRGADPQGPSHPRRRPPGAGPHHPVARPQGHRGRGLAQPGRPPGGGGHRAGVARGWHLPGVVRAFRPGAVDDGPRRPRACRLEDTVYRHRTERRGAALGPPLGRVCTATSFGRTGSTPWPPTGSRTAGGRPATTVGPAPDSESSTWWLRPCPRPAAARAPGRISQPGARCRYDFSTTAPSGAVRPPAGPEGSPSGPGRGEAEVRIRFRFAKLGKIRFTSQRDVARMWERALRRAGLPLAYTEGFSPRPQLSFGLALPTGCESRGRIPRCRPRRPPGRARRRRRGRRCPNGSPPCCPTGSRSTRRPPLDRRAGSLQQLVTSLLVDHGPGRGDPGRARGAGGVAPRGAVGAPSSGSGRVGPEQDDIRPVRPGPGRRRRHGRAAALEPATRWVRLVTAELATQPRGVRPIELLRGVARSGRQRSGPTPERTVTGIQHGIPVLDRACRTQQWIERDGIRAGAPRVGAAAGCRPRGHAWERAS